MSKRKVVKEPVALEPAVNTEPAADATLEGMIAPKQAVKKTEVMAVITTVSSPATIKSVAQDHNLNPQEVFVRVGFKVGDKEYASQNKLRFLGKKNYEKLLEAKRTGELISLTITSNEKGTLLYVNSGEHVEVDDLFSTPVEKVDTRAKVEDLFE